MATNNKINKDKVRKPKLIAKSKLAFLPDAPCPRCGECRLEDVKGGEVFCQACGCHISPKIFDQIASG